ncbi:TauD/TfdA family dioxygenase [Streptomyces palmae]|uniref:TauD/TfdA family dioxygenase n=1 Tax=Streptomyces palmae TaxID=1701085 RepID=A0A4Z0H6M6_9ACTN|nr:TauD/TfdA family dioxygenase [Streptomyces palmae]TGB08742.1 TauD/TfdA family dioxygenase [Streptomyces palmae]
MATGLGPADSPVIDLGPVATVVVETPLESAEHWLARHRTWLREAVTEHGALLVRGLGLDGRAAVAAGVGALVDAPFVEREGFAHREVYGPGVYSSAEWADYLPMCMHHEVSYARNFPGLMMFGCLAAGESGGEIEVADAAAIAQALPADLVAGFRSAGWQLTRNYYPESGLSWQDAFGTADRAGVEAHCAAGGLTWEWGPEGELKTRQRQSALLTHPRTGRTAWFNQIAFLSRWTLDPAIREYLLDEYGDDGLPFDTAYGDGRPLDAETVSLINATYEAHARTVQWGAGDLLVVDNMSTAHSRRPFTGHREVVVAMGDPADRAECH